MPLVQQKLLTLPQHLRSTTVISGVRVTRSLALCVYLVDRCLSFCNVFFWPLCVVCSSSIYDIYADYLQIGQILLSGEGNKKVQSNVEKFLV